jgi:hypothetical protein
MRLFTSFAVLTSLAGMSCHQPPVVSVVPAGELTFRVECPAGTPGAVTETAYGMTISFGPPQVFLLEYAGPSMDASGGSAIAFEIVEDQKARFTAMSESCLDLALAIYIDGTFISAPTVQDSLPGAGIISGGLPRWTTEECNAWLARIKKN